MAFLCNSDPDPCDPSPVTLLMKGKKQPQEGDHFCWTVLTLLKSLWGMDLQVSFKVPCKKSLEVEISRLQRLNLIMLPNVQQLWEAELDKNPFVYKPDAFFLTNVLVAIPLASSLNKHLFPQILIKKLSKIDTKYLELFWGETPENLFIWQ